MKSWETQLLKHILNEKFLQEDEKPELQKEDKKAFLQAVANYHRLGEIVYAKRGLKEVAKTVQNIVEKAEALTMQESEHWFDNVTVSRHMKQLKEAHKVFEKTSTEMTGLQQRLEAAYDDMGSILGRYYNVGNSLNEDDRYTSDWDEGIYIELIKQYQTPLMQQKIANAAKKKFFVDPKKVKFETNPGTKKYSVFIPFAGDYQNMMDVLKALNIPLNESNINEAKRSKFLLYTNPGNSTNSAYIAIGAEDVREVQRDARTYRDSYKILYQGTGTQEDLEKATKRFSNYSFGKASIDESLNEGKSQEWIVFLPIKKDNIIDIDDSLFGVYNDEEYDRIAPFDKVENYTTSLSFPDMKTAKEFTELVKKAKGDMKSSAYAKVTEFESKNKISK